MLTETGSTPPKNGVASGVVGRKSGVASTPQTGSRRRGVVGRERLRTWLPHRSDGTAVAAAAWYGSIWYSTDSGARFVEDKSAPNKTFWSSISMDSTGTKLAACVQSDEGAADGSIWLSPPPPASSLIPASHVSRRRRMLTLLPRSLEPTAKPAAAPPTPAQQLPVFGPVKISRVSFKFSSRSSPPRRRDA